LRIHKLVQQFQPKAIVIDPITNLVSGSNDRDVHAMLVRLLDFLKVRGITALFASLTTGGKALEQTNVAISSLIDTWVLLRDIELNGERNRCLYLVKSRGMAHSNQLREFLMGKHGIRLIPAYIGPGGVLTGSSRLAQEAREKADLVLRDQAVESQRLDLDRQRKALQAQIATLESEFTAKEQQMQRLIDQAQQRESALVADQETMSRSRGVNSGNGRKGKAAGGGR
jgi:circadian clock protein KaiC